MMPGEARMPPSGKSPTVGGRAAPFAPLLNPRNSMSITNTKGLLNMPGQNNCFLNSAVQVLWHLDIFRRSFRELCGHACMEHSCIFCALKELFAQFQYSQESALPPDALRRALAETFCDQRRFQLGFMDDAAECFENILMRIHFHIANNESEDMCSALHCIPHQKFAMTLVEQTVCHACGATSEPLPFTQMVHYVPSSALCSQAKLMKEKSDQSLSFSELLRKAGGLGDLRDCPSSCGAAIQIRKTLMNRPEIVSIGLVWDSERPTIDHIMDVFKTIGMSLKLQDVFHSVVDSRWAASATHQLVGIVTYYGKHYSTFFFHTKLRVWIYFDDAAVREIGPKWEQVVEKCCRGHFQPLLLLYANPHGSPVNTSTAPRAITVVPGHRKNITAKDSRGMIAHENKNTRTLINNASNAHRRALTPNPEVSCDISANIQPRRAVTPSGELCWTDEKNNAQQGHRDHNHTNSLHSNQPLIYNPLKLDHGLCSNPFPDQSDLPKSIRIPPRLSIPNCTPNTEEYQPKPLIINSPSVVLNRPASVEDILKSTNSSSSPDAEKPHCLLEGDPANPEASSADSSYISRKAVENVLHLQKLQWQRSVIHKNGHVVLGQRNSSSSLESLDNVFMREKGLGGLLNSKLEIPDAATMARRRDSGNWSGGDRSSASSSSTTSLDNAYFYVLGNKRMPNCPRPVGRPGEMLHLTDPGYDSFSVSSSDSYPSAINCSPGKLGQIPEHVQTAFVPYDMSQLQYCLKDLKSTDHFPFGLKDDCDKLCAEADIFVAKSVERENAGDMSMAALLSDTAAAKARAAMDMPYTSSQALAMAKMKHSMCLIRSSNLHRKMKEAEAALCRKSKEFATDSLSPKSSVSSIDQIENSYSAAKDGSEKQAESSKETKSSSGKAEENPDSSIEIYATLPKKSLKKKGALSSFVESLTGDESSEEKPRDKKNQEPKTEKSGASSEKSSKSPISKKKSNSPKNTNRDSDLSDYSCEWEQTKKPTLYRTYSGPTNSKNDLSDLNSSCNQSFADHPAKKQHRIRRKLMGGFMRRKNRSLPDLREGQDSGSETTRSYDDCFFTQTPVPSRKKQDGKGPENADCSESSSQSLPKTANAVKDSKKINRSNTPPPYKPPPPISHANPNSSPQKRAPVHQSPTEVPRTDKLPSNHIVNIPNVHELMKSRSPNHVPLFRDDKSLRKMSAQCLPHEMPASAAWLKELQMKQEELNQKKRLQEERERWKSGWNSEISTNKFSTSIPDPLQNVALKIQPTTEDEKEFKGSRNPQKISQVLNSNSTASDKDGSKPPHDLVLKLESDVPDCHPQNCVSPPHVFNHFSVPGQNKMHPVAPMAGTNGKHNVPTRPFQTVAYRLPHQKSPAKESDSSKPLVKERLNGVNSAKQVFPNQSLLNYVYNSHLTDAQLTNVLRIGANRSSFRNSNGQSDASDDSSARHPKDTFVYEAKRPEKPPDYETAIQRLELLRSDRTLANCCTSGNCLTFEALLEQAKKRRGPKKSVTFSDKVVLVACAGDEDNDFIPNPLLERVYKQHFMQNSPCASQATSPEQNQNVKASNEPDSETPLSTENRQNSQDSSKVNSPTSCNLCHKKLVESPNLYCPDCAFYMSRFQQK